MLGSKHHFFQSDAESDKIDENEIATVSQSLLLKASGRDPVFDYQPGIAEHFLKQSSPVYSFLGKLTGEVDGEKAHVFVRKAVTFVACYDYNFSSFAGLQKAWLQLYAAIRGWNSNSQEITVVEEAAESIKNGNILGYYFLAMLYFERAEFTKKFELYDLAIKNLICFLMAIPVDVQKRKELFSSLQKSMPQDCNIQVISIEPFIMGAEAILGHFGKTAFNFDRLSNQDQSSAFNLILAKYGKSIPALDSVLKAVDALFNSQPFQAVTMIRDVCVLSVGLQQAQLTAKAKEKLKVLHNSAVKEACCASVLTSLHLNEAGKFDVSVILPLVHENINEISRILLENQDAFLKLNREIFYKMIELIVLYDNSSRYTSNKKISSDYRSSTRKILLSCPGQTSAQVLGTDLFTKQALQGLYAQGIRYSDLSAEHLSGLEKLCKDFWDAFFVWKARADKLLDAQHAKIRVREQATQVVGPSSTLQP